LQGFIVVRVDAITGASQTFISLPTSYALLGICRFVNVYSSVCSVADDTSAFDDARRMYYTSVADDQGNSFLLAVNVARNTSTLISVRLGVICCLRNDCCVLIADQNAALASDVVHSAWLVVLVPPWLRG
jgi:hypothetical protein